MTELLQIYLNLFKWDIAVFSNPWMYIPLLIPISCFLMFFSMKWVVLTAPFWIPLGMIFSAVKKSLRK